MRLGTFLMYLSEASQSYMPIPARRQMRGHLRAKRQYSSPNQVTWADYK
jgi:hypothetical protein